MSARIISVLLLTVLSFTLCAAKSNTVDRIRDHLIESNNGLTFPAVNKRSITEVTDMTDSTTCSEERVNELLASLSEECNNYLFFEVVGYEFEQESEIMCQSCGFVLYSLLQCLGAEEREMELYNVLCTENEYGDTCYELLGGEGVEELEVVSKCQDMRCTDDCRRDLEDSFSQYGCCLYSLVAINTSMTAAQNMWTACGIEEPGMCGPAFNGEEPTATTDSDEDTESSDEPEDGMDPSGTTMTSTTYATTEPNSATTEPSSAATEPSSATTEPNTEPSFDTSEPSSATTETSSATTEPNTQPSFDTSEPSSATTEPSSATTEPSSATTEPSSATTPSTLTTESTPETQFTVRFDTETEATTSSGTTASTEPSTVTVNDVGGTTGDGTAQLQGAAGHMMTLGLATALIPLMGYLCMM